MAGMFENFRKYEKSFTALEQLNQEFTAREFEAMRQTHKVWVGDYWFCGYDIMSLNALREHGFIVVTRKENISKSNNEYSYSYKGETVAPDVYQQMPRELQQMCEVKPNKSNSKGLVRNYYKVNWNRINAYLDEYDKFCNNIETEIYPLLDVDFRMAKHCVKEFRWALNKARTKFTKLCWNTTWYYWDKEVNKSR